MKPSRWPRRVQSLSLLGFACLPIGALGSRFGAWGYQVGLAVFGSGIVLVLLTAVGGLAGMWLARRRGVLRDSGTFETAPIVAVVVLFFLFPYLNSARTAPPIHQVSTDLDDPPEFRAILRERGSESNPVLLTREMIAAQREAYPWIVTLFVRGSADAAYETAMLVVEDMGLAIVDADPQRRVIEATDMTFWFGFKDDVAIRVRAEVGGAIVDMRSVSRVGQSDLGVNADRVGEFFERYQAELAGAEDTR